jgi:isoaspartyl peptidase/L-asparaginase-like protein (Ntn-hydrolase superfamily)
MILNNIKPKIVIHGGYGSFEGMNDTRKAVHESLTKIVNKAYAVLLQKMQKQRW